MATPRSTAPSASSETSALTRRDASSSSSLGPYGPTRSTLQQKVLTEEAYTSTLSKLIRRDFFPHLERLEAENAYLDALTTLEEPGGEERLERAVRRLVGHEIRAGVIPPPAHPAAAERTGSRATFETTDGATARSVSSDETPRFAARSSRGGGEWDPTPINVQRDDLSTPRISSNGCGLAGGQTDEEAGLALDGLTMSLFQARYTSEDNASFLDLLEVGERRRREAYRWAYDAEKRAIDKHRKALQAANLEAEAGFQASLENAPPEVQRRIGRGERPKLITSNGEAGQGPTQVLALEQPRMSNELPLVGHAEVSPATDEARSLQSWPLKARNALFFGPDADRSTTRQRTSSLARKGSAAATQDVLFDDSQPDRTPGINFANTRLPDDEEQETTGSETPRSSHIDAAIGGVLGSSSGSIDAVSQADEDNHRGSADRPTTDMAGYSFVSPLPSPRPGDLGEERVRQLMTWGTIMGTPRAVGKQQVSPSLLTDGKREGESAYDGSFRIPPTPKRDMLARQLADKAGASRKRAQSPSTALRTFGAAKSRRSRADLSPAARTLLDRTSRQTSLGNSLLSGQQSVREERSTSERLRRERWTPSPSPGRGK